jgi:hypothetical protein
MISKQAFCDDLINLLKSRLNIDLENNADDYGTVDRYELIHTMIGFRRNRERLLGPELFADPAWDMLLDLYAAHLRATRPSVSSLCIAATVPATTALRWLNILEKKALVVREPDSDDGRRYLLSLSSLAIESLNALFDGRFGMRIRMSGK